MSLEVTLRDRPDLGRPVVGSTSSVVRDPVGRIFLAHNSDPVRINTFGPAGTFIEAIGSAGQGPGQFTFIGGLVLGADGNVHAFDRFQARMTTFSPDLSLVESKLLPVRVFKGLFVGTGIVVAAPSRSRELIGLPLHLLGSDLQVVRSFGAIDETARPDSQIVQFRAVALGANGRIWSAPYHKYLIEEWDPATGIRHRAFERAAGWFEPWYFERPVRFDSPPQPRFEGVWQDENGLLWALAIVGAATWTDGILEPEENGDGLLRLKDAERLYDSYVEVIDPSSGQLLLSERVPQYLTGFTNDGLLIGFRHPDDEEPQLQLWKATIRRGRGDR